MKANLFFIFFSATLTSNMALTYFLGLCPFVSLSKTIRGAFGMGVAVTLVMVITAGLNHLIYHHILIPYKITYMMFLIFILLVATTVQVTEMIIDRFFPYLYNAFGLFLPLITVNCAILGVSLFMVVQTLTFLETMIFSFGSGSGWLIAIVGMAGLRKRLAFSYPITHIGETGITLILAGLMALSFLGFSGIGR